jgi:hypothetical protein
MAQHMTNTSSKRGPKGRFLPGNREGPGRPKGSRNKTTLIVEALLEGEAEELTRALIDRAKAGSGTALQLVFERLAPARKDRSVHVKLPAIRSPQDLLAAQWAIIAQAAAGELTPSEASSMADLLELGRRAIESFELEARLTTLEDHIAQRSPQ